MNFDGEQVQFKKCRLILIRILQDLSLSTSPDIAIEFQNLHLNFIGICRTLSLHILSRKFVKLNLKNYFNFGKFLIVLCFYISNDYNDIPFVSLNAAYDLHD